MEGISNKTNKNFINKKNKEDDFKKIVGVISSNYINKFINFHDILIQSEGKYPFVIMNTDRSDKKGTHWWIFLDLHPKKEIFFDSFGFEGFKEFIIQDDKKTINKIFYNLMQKIKKL